MATAASGPDYAHCIAAERINGKKNVKFKKDSKSVFAWSTSNIFINSSQDKANLDWIPASKRRVEFVGRHQQHLRQAVRDWLALEQQRLPVSLQGQRFLEELFLHGAQLAGCVDQHFGDVVFSQQLLKDTKSFMLSSLCADHVPAQ